LRFRLYSLSDEVLALDKSAHSVFRALKVSASGRAGGGVLENIEEYNNAFVTTLYDLTGSSVQMNYAGTVAEGFNTSLPADSSKSFCIPLMSGIVGTMQQRYLHVGAMVRTHLTVELTIEYQDKLYAASANPKA
jgi:hypothetical protein